MNSKLRALCLLLLCPLCLLLSGCAGAGAGAAPEATCQVVIEDGEGFSPERSVYTVPRGETLTVSLSPEAGYAVTGADYEGCTLSQMGDTVILTLPQVRYSTVVTVETARLGHAITYCANGGEGLTAAGDTVALATGSEAARVNTDTGLALFARAGYTLTGWNTAPDGSGAAVGLGSRVDWTSGLTLYAQWSRWTPEEQFDWVPSGSGVAITACRWTGDTLVIPATLDGKPVYTITAEACAALPCTSIVLPAGLRTVEADAFRGCQVESLTLSDDLEEISDYSFRDCAALRTLHVNAVEAPVYSGNYFATFADKFDRLCTLTGHKLVLFSGSSARFGYDSAALDAAFPDYEVVNMGVFAYTSATPQLQLILTAVGEGDLLLHSPEFDAAQQQFCIRSDLEDSFWCMMEANYDMAALLDLRDCSAVFTGFSAYCTGKRDMTPSSYAVSPSGYDEDGNRVISPSYNAYGDYICDRPNPDTDDPVYGLEVDYTPSAFPMAWLDSLNGMYRKFLDKGVTVYFTYAPRNRLALSEDSTPEARRALADYFQENLIVPVISDLEDSLYPGHLLYGTDNHLSTEGVQIRTAQIIADLQAQLALDGLEGTT